MNTTFDVFFNSLNSDAGDDHSNVIVVSDDSNDDTHARALKFSFSPRCRMQTRSSDEISVCLSVRLSVKRVHCDKTEERSVHIFIPYDGHLA